jgi:hypothetical protein
MNIDRFHFNERQSMTVVSLPRRDAFRAHERAGGRGEIRDAHTDDEDAPPGDANARFNNLVLPHLGDAYSPARWITGSRADAEDVVQDACLRAFRAIGGFAGGPSAFPNTGSPICVIATCATSWQSTKNKECRRRTQQVSDDCGLASRSRALFPSADAAD